MYFCNKTYYIQSLFIAMNKLSKKQTNIIINASCSLIIGFELTCHTLQQHPEPMIGCLNIIFEAKMQVRFINHT